MTMTVLDQDPPVLYTDVIAQNARYFASKTCVICGPDRLTWAEFDSRTNRVANALIELGLSKGDTVCLHMGSSVAMFELLWGVIKAGGVVAPLNVMMAGAALPAMVENAGAKMFFADGSTVEIASTLDPEASSVGVDRWFAMGYADERWRAAEVLIDTAADTDPAVQIDPSDSMSIIYSSGTTGVPKGIEHSHHGRLMYPLGFGPGLHVDRYATTLCATPLYTNGTWIVMLPTVYAGGTVVLLPRFSPAEFFGAVEREGCTHTFLVPTQSIGLVESGLAAEHDVSSMRVLLSGGQRLNTSTFDDLTEAFPGTGLYEVYGMTEGFVSLAVPEDWKQGKRGSVGVPIYACDVRIIDSAGREVGCEEIGEIAGYSPGLMLGYRGQAELTRELVWHGPRNRTYIKSGDLGRVDRDGFLYVEGRSKDMIKSGGLNVFASDIEEVFASHPDVVECAAVAIPHPKWVETPMLFAIVRLDSGLGEDELKAWGNAKLSKYQRVTAVEFRDDFPRATYGKVRKRDLRDPYWSSAER
jgi:long-chain acyl-CoA synthetase